MRLIGFALLALLIAGAAIVLARFNYAEAGRNALMSERTIAFENRLRSDYETSGRTVSLRRASPSAPAILSGLPAYQTVTFAMPYDARPLDGTLFLDLTSQVFDDVEAVARINVNGVRHGEIILPEGKAFRSVEIELDDRDLAADNLRVSVSLHGRGSTARCDAEGDVSAILEIEPSSRLDLTLSESLSSVRDRIAVTGDVLMIGWAANLDDRARQQRLALAALLQARGHEVRFSSDSQAAGMFSLDELVDLASDRSVPDEALSYPVSFEEPGQETGLRTFSGVQTWRRDYTVDDLPDAQLPRSFALSMWLGPEPQVPPRNTDEPRAGGWLITVLLNGRVVHQDRPAASISVYEAQIALPASYHRRENEIEVQVRAAGYNSGVCATGPDLSAEMLATSVLLGGGEIYTDDLAVLRQAIIDAGSVDFSFDGTLAPVDATIVSDIMADLAPGYFSQTDADSPVAVTVLGTVSRQSLAAFTPAQRGIEHWLVLPGADDAGTFTARPIASLPSTYLRGPAPVGVVVSIPDTSGNTGRGRR